MLAIAPEHHSRLQITTMVLTASLVGLPEAATAK